MKKNNRKWMLASAFTGLFFFALANFTNFFHGSAVIAAFIQFGANAFVSISWGKNIKYSKGFEQLASWIGMFGPFIFAGITIYRVIIPRLIY